MTFRLSTALICLALGALSACATADVKLPANLVASANVYNVKGKSSLRWKDKLTFGNYVAKETKKTFPTQTDTEFLYTNSRKAKQSFNLQIENLANGSHAELIGKHLLRTSGFNIRAVLPDSDTFNTNSEDNFYGQIKLAPSMKAWSFHIVDMSVSTPAAARGKLTNGNTVIHIKEITELDANWSPGEPIFLGLSFYDGDKPIGAVQYQNGGKVWLNQNISEEQRDVMAALASAVILKEDN